MSQRAHCRALKVVHHPTIIAAHAWGRQWQFAGDVDLRSKFWGRSIELHPVGVLKLTFADGDQYSWHKVRLQVLPFQSIVDGQADMYARFKTATALQKEEAASDPVKQPRQALHTRCFVLHILEASPATS